MRVTSESVIPQILSAQEWRRDLTFVSTVVGPSVAARINGHVRALEKQIEALQAAQSEQQDPRQR